jgi:arginine repressor
MPPRSKVAGLPAEVKAWLDQALAENNFSDYEALADELTERGYAISKSALHRYGADFESRLSALKLASEQAKAVVAAAPDEEGAVNEALTRMVQEQLFNLLLAGEGKVDLAKVAKAVAELGRASVTQKKWQAEHRKTIREEYAAEAAKAVSEELRGQDGMSEQLESRIRGILLGKA